MIRVTVPQADGTVGEVELDTAPVIPSAVTPTSRVAFAAAHVVADSRAAEDPSERVAVDWDATLAFRHHLWACGLGVAEAMDTAQRGMGVDWPTSAELIRRSAAEATTVGGALCAGVGTDQLSLGVATRSAVEAAYADQLEVVATTGAIPVVMASRALAAVADGPDTYHEVYGRLLSQVSEPVILHWLGEAFDPALAGYWGHADPKSAAQEVVDLISDHVDKVDGIKVSVLDADLEVALRHALPESVRCYTGDDFNFPDLIMGDDRGYSDALLGIFDPIAPVASAALACLDAEDQAGYDTLMAPTLPLSRELFRAPTWHYKVGVVFCAWLAGHQSHFRMVGGLESQRSAVHLGQVLRLASAAGVLPDPELAAARAQAFFTVAGVDAR